MYTQKLLNLFERGWLPTNHMDNFAHNQVTQVFGAADWFLSLTCRATVSLALKKYLANLKVYSEDEIARIDEEWKAVVKQYITDRLNWAF